MNAFEEFNFGDKYVLRFYRGDNGLVCDINESMVPELHEVAKEMSQQQAEIEALKKALEPWVMYVDEFARVPPETWQKLADCAKMTSEWKKK